MGRGEVQVLVVVGARTSFMHLYGVQSSINRESHKPTDLPGVLANISPSAGVFWVAKCTQSQLEVDQRAM